MINQLNIKNICIALILVPLLLCCEDTTSSNEAIHVRRIEDSMNVNVEDLTLDDWNSNYLVLQFPLKNGITPEWDRVRNEPRQELSDRDVELNIYMAHDELFWYIAITAMDDEIFSVLSNSSHPYSGDSVEIFFAGDKLGSRFDFHGHTIFTRDDEQSAYFQLVIPPVQLTEAINYFPAYRTDLLFRDNFIQDGGMIRSWSIGSKWMAEVRIPKEVFDSIVTNRINGHEPLKINIDYLDYDDHIAIIEGDFSPNNVYCLDKYEDNVNKPYYMRNIIFE